MPAATRYRHYKGGIYELVCEAVMEADHTPVMVYRGQDGTVWVRPRAAFFETVDVDGAAMPRFTAIPALPEPSEASEVPSPAAAPAAARDE